MPKRTTLTFTSEDAPQSKEGLLFVYYCRFTGKHAFTIDCDLKELPKRRTDGARIINLEEHTTKLYTEDGGMKLVKRHNGNIERQYRLNVGKLPVAYRCSPDGKFVYVIDGAVATYVNQNLKQGNRMLVPPCIKLNPHGATEVRLEIEDRAQRPGITRITADSVRIHIAAAIGHDSANGEMLTMLAKALGARLPQLQLLKSGRGRSRFLVVDHLKPQEVFEKFQAVIARGG